MNIYVLCNAFWSNNNSMSGGDKRLIEILRRCPPDISKDVTVIAPYKFLNILQHEGIHGIKVICTSTKYSEKANIIAGYFIHTVKALSALHTHKQGDIIYTSSDFLPDILPAYFAKRKCRHNKWVALIHHCIEHYRTRPGSKAKNFISYYAQKISFSFIRRFSDKVLLVSPIVKETLEKAGFKNLYMVNNGVDAEYINMISNDSSKHYDGIFMGRLSPSKGIYDIADIWKEVCASIPNARLALIGGGSDEIRNELLSAFQENGISDKIDILGFVETEECFKLMKASKIFIFPSHEEGWGIAVAEAMACGLCVVSYDLPVFKYIFSDKTIRVKMFDKTSLSKCVTSLLQNDTLLREKANAGKKFVITNYTWNNIADQEWKLILK